MKMRIVALALVAMPPTGVLWVRHRADGGATPSYRLGKVERGSLSSTVSATGTLHAVRTVEVGTQVSGQISALNVDFNSHVKKGQLIARIDPILQQQAVQDAEAGVARATALVTQTHLEYERSLKLHEQQIATDAEFNVAQSNYAVAKANLTSALISLDKAKQNLSYTNIYSPIDGVVVERAMDVGQTVAASLSAPKLFVIANDLSRMQILASIDESDIGKIKPGQAVTFTVQSYPDRKFAGRVDQMRLNASTLNNVVSYTVVVSVSNSDGTLLPGMTASVKLVTASAENVLTIPTAALRFTPPSNQNSVAGTPSVGGAPEGPPPGGGVPPAQGFPSGFPGGADGSSRAARPTGAQSGTSGTVWTVNAEGSLAPHPVTIGLTDGHRTQVSGSGLQPGASVVISLNQGTSAGTATAGSSNPLQPTQSPPPGPRGLF